MHARANDALAIAVAFLVVLSPARARAADPAAAQALFDEGMKLMESKQYSAACAKLEESERLDPAIGTQFNLADCYQQLGRTASAWTNFTGAADAAAATKQPARERAARARANALFPKLTRMTITITKDVDGLQVTRNDVVVGRAQWSSALPIDPGTYTIKATAPGKGAWEALVPANGEGVVVAVTVPALDDATSGEPTPPPPAAIPPAPAAPTAMTTAKRNDEPLKTESPITSDTATTSTWSTQRTIAAVTAGVGFVAVGVGVFYGLRSMSKHDAVGFHCDGGSCDKTGFDANNDAKTAGNVSTIAFGASGALLVGAAILWFTAPVTVAPLTQSTGRVRVAPTIAPGMVGLTANGAWR